MARIRLRTWLQALLLSIPLVVFSAWLGLGAVKRFHRPRGGESRSATSESSRATSSEILPGFPPPEADLPAGRLEERVDGAADHLRSHGCRRLLAWHLAAPPADLEILVFDRDEGAAAVLARDAGPGREAGPGDEASVSPQAVLFRRGALYARLIADPSAAPDAEKLMAIAAEIDRTLVERRASFVAPVGEGAL